MNFGLNKVTGTGRQTIEQLKHKVIDGGGGGGGGGYSYVEVPIETLTKITEEGIELDWYLLPELESGEELICYTTITGGVGDFSIAKDNPSVEAYEDVVNICYGTDGADEIRIGYIHIERIGDMKRVLGTSALFALDGIMKNQVNGFVFQNSADLYISSYFWNSEDPATNFPITIYKKTISE